MSTLALCITHAAHIESRRPLFERLKEQLGVTGDEPLAFISRTGVSPIDGPAHYYREETARAANWAWSELQWRWGFETGADHVVYLQDDVVVADNFWLALKAMLAAVPDQLIAFHCAMPGARRLLRSTSGERLGAWYTTDDGLVGIGYVFPKQALAEFLHWRKTELKPGALERVSEDSLIDLWCMATGRKVWHPVPSIIDHDTSTESTYGNGHHLYRRPQVTWEDYCAITGGPLDDLQDLTFWETDTPAYPLHFGRFYSTLHEHLPFVLKDESYAIKVRDLMAVSDCPSPFNRYFIRP